MHILPAPQIGDGLQAGALQAQVGRGAAPGSMRSDLLAFDNRWVGIHHIIRVDASHGGNDFQKSVCLLVGAPGKVVVVFFEEFERLLASRAGLLRSWFSERPRESTTPLDLRRNLWGRSLSHPKTAAKRNKLPGTGRFPVSSAAGTQ